MHALPITMHVAAVLAAMLVLMSLPISLRRRKAKISLGVGEDVPLQNLVRAHGNFTEYAPMGLIILALLEMADAGPQTLWIIAALLVVGRIAHAIGMYTMILPLRVLGTALTQAMLVYGAVVLTTTLLRVMAA
jgi:uncharacterized membrane protein YecN with MAPEG domain